MDPVVLALLGAMIVFAVSMDGSGPDLYWNQTHHAYYGWALTLLGMARGSPVITGIGLVLAWDDAIQHAVQRFARRPRFRFVVHRLYEVVYPFVGWLNVWLDRVLGRHR